VIDLTPNSPWTVEVSNGDVRGNIPVFRGSTDFGNGKTYPRVFNRREITAKTTVENNRYAINNGLVFSPSVVVLSM